MASADSVVRQCPGFIQAYKELYEEGKLDFDVQCKAITSIYNSKVGLLKENDQEPCKFALRYMLEVNIEAMKAYSQNSLYERIANYCCKFFWWETSIEKAEQALVSFDEILMDDGEHDEFKKNAMNIAQRWMVEECALKNKDRIFYEKDGHYGELIYNPEKDCAEFRKVMPTSVFASKENLRNFCFNSDNNPKHLEVEEKSNFNRAFGDFELIQPSINRTTESLDFFSKSCAIFQNAIGEGIGISKYYINEGNNSISFFTKENGGKCAGMCDKFIADYFRTKNRFDDPCKHMKFLGGQYTKGANLEAVVLQNLTGKTRTEMMKLESLEKTYYNFKERVTSWDHIGEKKYPGHFKQLPVGVYEMSLPGHATVYIKESEDLGFYYDPNVGVVKLEGKEQGEKLFKCLDLSWHLIRNNEEKMRYFLDLFGIVKWEDAPTFSYVGISKNDSSSKDIASESITLFQEDRDLREEI